MSFSYLFITQIDDLPAILEVVEVRDDGKAVFRQRGVSPLEESQRYVTIPGSPAAEGTQRTDDSVAQGQGIEIVGCRVAGDGTEGKLLEEGGIIPLVGGDEECYLSALEHLDQVAHHVPIVCMLEIILASLPYLVVSTADVNADDEIALLLILRHLPVHLGADVGIGTIDGQQFLLHEREIPVGFSKRPRPNKAQLSEKGKSPHSAHHPVGKGDCHSPLHRLLAQQTEKPWAVEGEAHMGILAQGIKVAQTGIPVQDIHFLVVDNGPGYRVKISPKPVASLPGGIDKYP